MTALDRFETLGALYLKDTGHLRPSADGLAFGGSEATDADTDGPDNRDRFDRWIDNGDGLTMALDRIVMLEELLQRLADAAEEAREFGEGADVRMTDVIDEARKVLK